MKQNIKQELKKILSILFDTVELAVLALVIVVPIRYFIFQPFVVSGNSMHPNFENKDYLLIDEISFRFNEPERGEVVVFKAPQRVSTNYIKRIIGLPNEVIEISDGKIFISSASGEKEALDESKYLPDGLITSGEMTIALKQDEYFVLGDNRLFSSDSRSWGVLPRQNIVGKVFFRALPVNSLAFIENPVYIFDPIEP